MPQVQTRRGLSARLHGVALNKVQTDAELSGCSAVASHAREAGSRTHASPSSSTPSRHARRPVARQAASSFGSTAGSEKSQPAGLTREAAAPFPRFFWAFDSAGSVAQRSELAGQSRSQTKPVSRLGQQSAGLPWFPFPPVSGIGSICLRRWAPRSLQCRRRRRRWRAGKLERTAVIARLRQINARRTRDRRGGEEG